MAIMDFQNLRDMFDGGGAGRAGAEFEGGGILSMIANLIAKPLGSQQGQGQPQGLLGGMGSQGQAMPPVAPPSPVELQYSGRGNVGMPQPPNDMLGNMPYLTQIMQDNRQARAGAAFDMGQMTPNIGVSPQYSGRGSAGMPMPQGVSPEEQAIIEYLRSIGAM